MYGVGQVVQCSLDATAVTNAETTVNVAGAGLREVTIGVGTAVGVGEDKATLRVAVPTGSGEAELAPRVGDSLGVADDAGLADVEDNPANGKCRPAAGLKRATSAGSKRPVRRMCFMAESFY